MGIGTLADLPAPEARTKAANLAAMVRSGIDPIEARQRDSELKAAEKARTEAESVTFRQAAEAYIAAHRAGWRNAKHADQWVNTLEKYAYPVIGDRSVANVGLEEVLRILRPIWEEKTETAARVRSRIELILSYSKALKLRDGENPAIWRGNLDALLPKPSKLKKVRHHPALPYERVSEFMGELQRISGSGARALEFAILTAARSGDVRGATWSEIDMDGKTWTVPAERLKIKTNGEHRVPLSATALSLLKKLHRLDGVDLLFPGEREKKPVSDMTLSAVIKRMNQAADIPRWIDARTSAPVVPHGFRSTFRDWVAEATHYPHEMAEMALAHAIGNKVEAAYRRGDMFERRREMMNDWGKWCGGKRSKPRRPVAG